MLTWKKGEGQVLAAQTIGCRFWRFHNIDAHHSTIKTGRKAADPDNEKVHSKGVSGFAAMEVSLDSLEALWQL